MKPTIVEGDRVFVNKLAYDLKVPYTTWPIAKWIHLKEVQSWFSFHPLVVLDL